MSETTKDYLKFVGICAGYVLLCAGVFVISTKYQGKIIGRALKAAL